MIFGVKFVYGIKNKRITRVPQVLATDFNFHTGHSVHFLSFAIASNKIKRSSEAQSFVRPNFKTFKNNLALVKFYGL